MKKGDYVRTTRGEITKIVKIKNVDGIDVLVFDKNVVFIFDPETKEIKKDHYTNELPLLNYININKLKISPNIIDLIEVGDYINGHRVAEIETLPTKQKLVVVGYGYDVDEISENNIKTIVTKEQFKSMEYKIGGKE